MANEMPGNSISYHTRMHPLLKTKIWNLPKNNNETVWPTTQKPNPSHKRLYESHKNIWKETKTIKNENKGFRLRKVDFHDSFQKGSVFQKAKYWSINILIDE